jgi:hypothetical protein
VPSFSPVKSKVVPDGTATDDRTMVAQDALDALAEAAPAEPLKVQLPARLATAWSARGLGVMVGGAARTPDAARAAKTIREAIMNVVCTGGKPEETNVTGGGRVMVWHLVDWACLALPSPG